MKKFLFFSLVGFQLSYAQNLINNGNFESWNNGRLSYWQKSPSDNSLSNAAQYVGNGTNGSYACRLGIGPNYNYTGRISQYVTIPKRYTKVTFRYLFPAVSAGRTLQVQLVRPGSPYPSTIVVHDLTVQSGTLGVWQNFETIYDVTSNSSVTPPYSLALFIFSNGFDFNNLSPYIVIDDVKVTSASDLASLSTNENQALQDIKILNPVKDKIDIQTIGKIEKIEIINVNGQLVKSLKKGDFGVADLLKGIYFLNIHTPKEIITKKIVKE